MQYGWKHYCKDDANLVDSWLDGCAIRWTGLDEGWQHFYDYWMTESRTGEGKDCCFIVSHESVPFAAVYIAIIDGEMTISEYIVAPDMRGKGHGAAAIKELLDNAVQLMNTDAARAKAAVFPDNIAAIKAFEKAGFVLASELHDECGDSLHYEYRFDGDC